ncbi:MAG: hypothetical protein RLZZ126_1247, partial [Pseudomonadota bacterium]
FKPGLVGGHCIGVDPYYLTYKADMVGYHPQVILAGRRINDGMGAFIARKTVQLMIRSGCELQGAKVNVLGLTFKENCPDLRNSKVPDIIRELRAYGVEVHVHDPLANATEADHEYGLSLSRMEDLPKADAVVIAVAHRVYQDQGIQQITSLLNDGHGCVVDVKGLFDRGLWAPVAAWTL